LRMSWFSKGEEMSRARGPWLVPTLLNRISWFS
jgi:hypothetical protein